MTEDKGKYNAGYTPPELPYGIEQALLRIFSFHVGREQAISRPDMVYALGQAGFHVSEREARAVINDLRKQGHPICSTGGDGGGYWLGKDWDDLDEYIQRELHARATDLLEQESALRREAEKRWGRYSPARQERLAI